MDKTQRYDWAKPGDYGKMKIVRIDDLYIDHAYQRRELSANNTLSIAREFRWSAFGAIVVMHRNSDGKLYVVDGQQRLSAARHRGDIDSVPCIVFESDGPKHEAEAFLALNTKRRKVSAISKFVASVGSCGEPETEISNWLKEQGLHVANSDSHSALCFPADLIRTWKNDKEAAKIAIIAQKELHDPRKMNAQVHFGMWWLARNGVNIRQHIEKLITLGGIPAMLRAISVLAIETSSGKTERTCGLAILRMINKSKKSNRIVIQGATEQFDGAN